MKDTKDIKQPKYIICKVDKVVFRDAKTDRTIMSVTKDDGKKTRLLGKIKKVEENYVLKATGSWSKDEKYGWQFNAELIQAISTNPLSDESEYLECVVTFIKVLREESGFATATAEDQTGKKIRLSGRLAKVRKGATIGVFGKWKHDERYGDELQVSQWEYKTQGEDTTLKFAAYYIKSLQTPKIEQPVDEKASESVVDTSGNEVAATIDNTVFSLDADLSKRADIQSITISDSIAEIEEKTFVGCNSLTEIIVSEGNSSYSSVDGVLYNKEKTELICYPSGKVGSFVIPDTVTRIADWAFCGCMGLAQVEIPNSVTTIGRYSFAYCSGLESVSLPESLKSIENRAFYCCFRLNKVLLHDFMVAALGAFEGCKEKIVRFVTSISWKEIELYDYKISIPNPYGTNEEIPCGASRAFMNNIIKRLTIELPKLDVIFREKTAPIIVSRKALDEAFAIIRENIIIQDVEIDWKDVMFAGNNITVPSPSGEKVIIRHPFAIAVKNKLLKRLAASLPKLIVRFEEGSDPVIVNKDVLDDVITILTKRKDYGDMIRSNVKSPDVLNALKVLSKKDTRVFVPRDMTPYLNFLSEHQAIDEYPIVPIEEYIGGSYEEGALFTLLIKEHLYIVWENFKDSRSTYLFRCTKDNYEDMRQRVFDYIMTQESSKRQFLRTKECKEIFGEKPRLVVHNNLESWSERLMSIEDLAQLEQYEEELAQIQEMQAEQPDEGPEDLYDDDDNEVLLLTRQEFELIKNIQVIVTFVVDPESYFYDDELWDEDGNSTALYWKGQKHIHAESIFTINNYEFEEEFGVDAGDSRDIYSPVDLPRIEIVSKSRFKDIDGIYERLCDIIERYDFEYATEDSEIQVEIINNGKTYSYEFTKW